MKATTALPHDPALPALVAIRAAGLAAAIPALGLAGRSVVLLLRSYTPGSRATLEARIGGRRFAVKAYADDPAREVELYQALTAALADDAGVRVPRLLAWSRDLRVLVVDWLEGPPANQLIKDGRGARAGELAACWLQRAASLPVKLGAPVGAKDVLDRVRNWVASLAAADPELGTTATSLAGILAQTQPQERERRLLHGTLYARHLLDLGDGVGLIDWQHFGQGPAELDAGAFLATAWRTGLRHGEAARAEEAFLAGTAGLVDEHALAWYRTAILLRLANKRNRRPGEWPARARTLLGEAARLAALLDEPRRTENPTTSRRS